MYQHIDVLNVLQFIQGTNTRMKIPKVKCIEIVGYLWREREVKLPGVNTPVGKIHWK